MKPFNLERAIAGDKVVTEDGWPYTLIGRWGKKLFWGDPKGDYLITDESGLDIRITCLIRLFMAPKEWWGVRCKTVEGNWFAMMLAFGSAEEAKEWVDRNFQDDVFKEPFLIKREEE